MKLSKEDREAAVKALDGIKEASDELAEEMKTPEFKKKVEEVIEKRTRESSPMDDLDLDWPA